MPIGVLSSYIGYAKGFIFSKKLLSYFIHAFNGRTQLKGMKSLLWNVFTEQLSRRRSFNICLFLFLVF